MVKRVFIFLALFGAIHSLAAKQAIILVYGAFTSNDSWMHSKGKFYKALQKATNSLTKIESFYWDQPFEGIFAFEKIHAAKKLADLVLKLKNTGYDRIEIYTHSYGGHITAIASQLLSSENEKLEVILQKEKTDKAHTSLEASDEYQQAHKLFQELKHEIKKHLVTKPSLTHQPHTPYLIDMVHTFALPHQDIAFRMDMNALASLINWWSRDPIAQELVGSSKWFTDHVRGTNLEYTIADESYQDGWLIGNIIEMLADFIVQGFGLARNQHTFYQQRKLLGKWISIIPHALTAESVNNFEHFSFEKDGILAFSTNQYQPPMYHFEIE